TFADPMIRSVASRVTISVADEAKHGHTLASTVTVTLKDGRTLSRRVDDFKGTPESPLDRAEMREKFLMLTSDCDGKEMARLFDRLQNLEAERTLDWVKVNAPQPARRKSPRRKPPPRKRKTAR